MIFPPILETTIIALMLSIGGGTSQLKHCSYFSWNTVISKQCSALCHALHTFS